MTDEELASLIRPALMPLIRDLRAAGLTTDTIRMIVLRCLAAARTAVLMGLPGELAST